MKKLLKFLLISILLILPATIVNAEDLGNRLSGKILLQVEDEGQAWYIEPSTQERAFLGRPDDAFRIMRELGLGIKHIELEKYLNSKFPDRLSGKIMLDVEKNGEAYYISPDNLSGYYLGRPTDAFNVMREMGLGITNNDLEKVPIFQKYAEQTDENTQAIKIIEEQLKEQQNKIVKLEKQLEQNNENISVPRPPLITPPAPLSVDFVVSDSGYFPKSFFVNKSQSVSFSVSNESSNTFIFVFQNEVLKNVGIGVVPNETRAITFQAPSTPGEYIYYNGVGYSQDNGYKADFEHGDPPVFGKMIVN